ncbi:S-layer homology domain-containing protein [Bengtsoniella intestinalis]|uniref:S-layer homology domain-containing protein n=1 Tax=Bengtsoniella intestinalis TaxID=3073143 RepID=UPI00391F548C
MKKLFLTLLSLTLMVTAMATTAFAAETVVGDTLSISGVIDTTYDFDDVTPVYHYQVGSPITINEHIYWVQFDSVDSYGIYTLNFADTYTADYLPIFGYENLSVALNDSDEIYTMEAYIVGAEAGTMTSADLDYICADGSFEILVPWTYFVVTVLGSIEQIDYVNETGDISVLESYILYTVEADDTAEETVEEVVTEAVETAFTDVSEEDAFYDAVLWAVDAGVTTGYDDGTFRPDATCTRGQVVTFLYRAAGEPEITTTENPFSDVSEDSPYYTAILWAVENGITTGYDDGTFRPNDTCTSAQVITFLYRAEGEPVTDFESELTADVADAYVPAITWADAITLLDGMDFVAGDASPRSDIVTYLYLIDGTIEMA